MTLFDKYASAGLGADVLPILPPDAELSPRSGVRPQDRGKVPGLWRNGVWSGFPRWDTVAVTDQARALWATWPTRNVGLQTRRYPAVDLDVTTPCLADDLERAAIEILGPAPVRLRGGSARRLLVYRLAEGEEPFRKARVEFHFPTADPGAPAEAVEVLGAGQQFVAEGVHPSGAAYSWRDAGLCDLGADELTPITLDKVRAFLEAIEALIELHGATLGRRSAGKAVAAGARRPIGDPDLMAPDIVDLMDAVQAIPCAELDYDQWVALTAAIKAACGGSEAFFRDVYLPWSLTYPGNDEEAISKRWASVHDAELGADAVFGRARNHGWQGGVTEFGPVPGCTPARAVETARTASDPGDADAGDGAPVQLDEASWLARFAYLAALDSYVDMETMRLYSEAAFKRMHAHIGDGPSSTKANAAMIFQAHPAAHKRVGFTYIPGGPRFVTEQGEPMLNRWRPSPLVPAQGVTAERIRPWLDHAAYIVPDERERGIMIDWMAHILQRPDHKANWAVLVGGDPGIGKDTLFQPLLRAIGDHNTRNVGAADVEGPYTYWAAETQLVVIGEIKNFTARVMEKLKSYITVPPTRVQVNIK